MGVSNVWIREERRLQKAVQRIITIEKPAQIPKLSGRARFSPRRLAVEREIRVLGPGVAVVMSA